jgi:hypothetical protein
MPYLLSPKARVQEQLDKMADFVQNSETKTAVRELTSPIPDVASSNSLSRIVMKTIFIKLITICIYFENSILIQDPDPKPLFFRFEVLQSDPAQSLLSLIPAYTSYVPARS